MYSSATPEWATPISLFAELEAEFGPFTLDACANAENAKVERFYSMADDGLAHSWAGERVWMNPPYGRGIGAWVKKAAIEPDLAVCLLPARTDTAWFHDWCLRGQVRFLRGRVKFGDGRAPAPFPSMVVVFRK